MSRVHVDPTYVLSQRCGPCGIWTDINGSFMSLWHQIRIWLDGFSSYNKRLRFGFVTSEKLYSYCYRLEISEPNLGPEFWAKSGWSCALFSRILRDMSHEMLTQKLRLCRIMGQKVAVRPVTALVWRQYCDGAAAICCRLSGKTGHVSTVCTDVSTGPDNALLVHINMIVYGFQEITFWRHCGAA